MKELKPFIYYTFTSISRRICLVDVEDGARIGQTNRGRQESLDARLSRQFPRHSFKVTPSFLAAQANAQKDRSHIEGQDSRSLGHPDAAIVKTEMSRLIRDRQGVKPHWQGANASSSGMLGPASHYVPHACESQIEAPFLLKSLSLHGQVPP